MVRFGKVFLELPKGCMSQALALILSRESLFEKLVGGALGYGFTKVICLWEENTSPVSILESIMTSKEGRANVVMDSTQSLILYICIYMMNILLNEFNEFS